MSKSKLTVRDYCLIGGFAAVISLMAQISIPMPYGVPMTMQTFAVPVAGILLGAKRGLLASLVYIILGAVGMPVFASFSGGFASIAGPTGGFILSFPLMAWLAGLGAEKGGKISLALGLLTGAVVNYIVGMLFFMLVTGNTLQIAFTACVLPFIPTAIIKAILAGVVGEKGKQALLKERIAI